MDKLKEAIQMVANTFEKEIPLIEECTIVSVDKDEKTCICKTNKRDTIIENVKLNAIRDIGVIQYPKVGSIVIVCVMNYTRFIMVYSEIEHFEVEFENNKFSIKENEVLAVVGKSQLQMTGSGFAIEANGVKLGQLLTDLTTAITKITSPVVAIGSPTGPIVNIAEFTTILPKIKQILK